jgi:hypothetical protein
VPKRKTTRRGTSQKRTAKTAKSSASPTRKAAARKTSKGKAAKRAVKPKAVERVSPEDEAAYTEALIQSGQAAPLDSEGKLPAGATHKIVEDPAGQIKVVRRRFSIS